MFLVFLSKFCLCELSFSREHKLLFIPIGLCFMKRHVWRISYFFIKRLTKIETLICFMKRHVWRVSYFFIKRLTKIETFSIFLNSYQKILENSKNSRKFQKLNFHFIKPYSPNSTIIITTYPCIYLYLQQSIEALSFSACTAGRE